MSSTISTTDLHSSIQQLLAAKEVAHELVKKVEHLQSNVQQIGDDSRERVSESLLQVGRIVENLASVEKNLKLRLPDHVYDSGVHYAAGRLGMSILNLFPTHQEWMLSHQEESIRQVAVRCGDLTDEQLQIALKDPEKCVRDAAILRQQNGNMPLINKDRSPELKEVIRFS